MTERRHTFEEGVVRAAARAAEEARIYGCVIDVQIRRRFRAGVNVRIEPTGEPMISREDAAAWARPRAVIRTPEGSELPPPAPDEPRRGRPWDWPPPAPPTPPEGTSPPPSKAGRRRRGNTAA
jgi:hypothetical protein